MKTFNRAKLRRLVEAGKVETVITYSFDDMYGEHRTHEPMQVRMKPAEWRDRKEGVCYVTPWDFESKSGRAYWRDETSGIVMLIVHGNSSYELRIKS